MADDVFEKVSSKVPEGADNGIKQSGAADQESPVPGEMAADLEDEFKKLRLQIAEYRRLDEDLAIHRVFEAARKKLISWLTFGGLLLTLLGAIGVREAEKYAEGLVDQQMKKLSSERIEQLVEQKSQTLVVAEIQKHEPTWNADARRLIQLAIAPIGSNNLLSQTLPPTSGAVDYTALMMPVRAEGQRYSPEGTAVAYAIEYQIAAHLHKKVRLSFEYIYCEAQMLHGGQSCIGEKGAVLSDEVRAVQATGVVSEQTMPFVAPATNKPIPVPRVRAADRFNVVLIQSLSTIEDMKSALRKYGPVVAAITVYDSFIRAGSDGVIRMPSANETGDGAMSVCVVGFDDLTKRFKVELAWGADWADHGFGYVPYDYMARYASEMWAISM